MGEGFPSPSISYKEDIMALGKTVFFRRLVDATVSLNLTDVDGVLPNKWFVMDLKTPRIGVPANYALSYFIDAGVEAMFKANYCEVEDMPGLVKLAKEKGYIDPSEEEVAILNAPKRDKNMLFAIIQGGNQAKLEELFKSADRERALELVQEKKDELSTGTISKIEKILGVAIAEEE